MERREAGGRRRAAPRRTTPTSRPEGLLDEDELREHAHEVDVAIQEAKNRNPDASGICHSSVVTANKRGLARRRQSAGTGWRGPPRATRLVEQARATARCQE